MRKRANRIGQRLVALVFMSGWLLMPLMPLLALALSWFTDRSSWSLS